MNCITIIFDDIQLIIDYEHNKEDKECGLPEHVEIHNIFIGKTSIIELLSDDKIEEIESKIMEEIRNN